MLWGDRFLAIPGGLPIAVRVVRAPASCTRADLLLLKTGQKLGVPMLTKTKTHTEVYELRDTVYASPCSVVHKTVFAVTVHPGEWNISTPMTCLSGVEARLAVLLSVHRDSANSTRLHAWVKAVTSAAVEFRRVPEDSLVSEYVLLQETLDAFQKAASLTVPRQALLVFAALRQGHPAPAADIVDQWAQRRKLSDTRCLEPPAQPLLICLGPSNIAPSAEAEGPHEHRD